MENEVTFALTSCCRFDLLERTIDSFIKNNDYPIKEYIMIDDGEDKFQHKQMITKYNGRFNVIIEGHMGHYYAIDRLYKEIKTEYFFHSEDDWEFYNGGGFIQQSIDILDEYKNIGIVLLRREDAEHPLLDEIYSTKVGTKFQKPVPGWAYGKQGYQEDGWFGFSLNPGLRRMGDYEKMKPISQLASERRCGWKFRDMGLEVAFLTTGYVRHIGWNRSKSG